MDELARSADLIVVGGGPVGLALAIGARRQGVKTLLVERSAPAQSEGTSFDGRMLALNLASQQLLERIGIWDELAPLATPIRHVHVSQQGHFGLTLMHAEEMGVPALGYSVLGVDLGRVLWAEAERAGVQVLRPAQVVDVALEETRVGVQLQDGTSIESVLLAGADGTHSRVREAMGWPLQEKDYGAHAVLAQVKTRQPHHGWSYERFTPDGPVALLPHRTHHHKAVYVCPDEQLDAVMALDDRDWLEAFAARIGPRLGGFDEVGPRLAYPLKEVYVPRVAEGRVALLGNASHTQHPVAAQGLNLGLRDVADYLDALQQRDAWGTAVWAQAYETKRQADHQAVMRMTDSLVTIFQCRLPGAGHLRGAGLVATQLMPGLKRRLARFSMGLES
ncbi:2-octaprenyl-6-methoxyphenol hydroxylase /2-octaprenyl-3-methyl-6-methoxy-1,4-benzoquinol hydroxylase [Sulfurivirga caldicuralii]|uniref:2-octaprenyl-6-methoxyphenol hydroxylase /2-octaprenyl-3-methyl-6-methoxy-1,4-benzoquinol hydroxylase n=1 Tax=Sulfurivirga caldicuralii TaxID=364032 RepID=A0A1N6EPK0_9GAMM|nr:FAD-dependent monooxygenase [Sulfurivirga caldicuralii]SIN84900.1 2-octaprenyl-6-methoxyphenol hydroxylase /2-octaprenyl-3-methyl-6-methoxy-1,4-benzoquinol hydroxylase [Sulfurivirga caldicuralii]